MKKKKKKNHCIIIPTNTWAASMSGNTNTAGGSDSNDGRQLFPPTQPQRKHL